MTTLVVRVCAVALCWSAFAFATHYEQVLSRQREAMVLLFGMTGLVLSFCAVLWPLLQQQQQQQHHIPSSRSKRAPCAPSASSSSSLLVDSLSLLMIGASLSPVLGTLTSSYASNTVLQMTVLAQLVHLVAAAAAAGSNSSPVSLNAAFAGILLQASRMQSSALSFAFTVFCTVMLVVLPRACCCGGGGGGGAIGGGEEEEEETSSLLDTRLAECTGAALLVVAAEYSTWLWFGPRTAVALAVLVGFVGHLAPNVLFARIKPDKLHGAWDLLRLDHLRLDDDD